MWCMGLWSLAVLMFVLLQPISIWAQTNSPNCKSVPCAAPYTQAPIGSPCGCVLPMQVEMLFNLTINVLFPAIPVLIEEIAVSTLLLQSQVRVIGAIADSQDQGRSIVTVHLVPLGRSFDNLTVNMIYQKFRNNEVLEGKSIFGGYSLIYFHYPGIASPASAGYPSTITGPEILPHEQQPLSVDVTTGSRKFSGSTVALIFLSSAIAAAAASGAIVLLILKFNNHSLAKRKMVVASSGFGSSSAGSFTSSMAIYSMSARKFSLLELERATDTFSPSNVIGQGGSGRVFSGILEDGKKVAVKIMAKDDQQKRNEFLAEVEMLSRLHHRNLVKLIGFCTQETIRCLVYELVPNGSVESHLHGAGKFIQPLDWGARTKIALGAARGLAYLHEDANPRVIHRDFKASNILVEDDFSPKIADFGLAKTAPEKEDQHISTSVMGTFGYVAPEYAMTGHLLVKSDVYSYGVVLLELMTGRRPVDLTRPCGQENLVNWARPLLISEEGLHTLADPTLEGKFSFDSFSRVAAIAAMCVQPELCCRPFMGEVVQALKNINSASEGGSSLTVSPQGSGGDVQSEAGDQGRDDVGPPLSASISIGHNRESRRLGELINQRPDVDLPHSGCLRGSFQNCSERHSLSGPSSSSGASYAWSIDKDSVYIGKSEHRVFYFST